MTFLTAQKSLVSINKFTTENNIEEKINHTLFSIEKKKPYSIVCKLWAVVLVVITFSSQSFAADDPGQLNVNGCAFVHNLDGDYPLFNSVPTYFKGTTPPYYENTFINSAHVTQSGDVSSANAITSDASGSGKFLLNRTGASDNSGKFFETVTSPTVITNRNYRLSFKLANESTTNISIIKPSINGVEFSATSAATGTGSWQQFDYIWNSGTATTAQISLETLRVTGSGNDFGFDELELCILPHVDAIDDAPASILNTSGGSTTNVVANDTLSGVANPTIGTSAGDVTLHSTGTAQDGTTALGLNTPPAAGSITMNTDGTITVAPNTTEGVYQYTYEICEVTNPLNCDTATVSVLSTAPEDSGQFDVNGCAFVQNMDGTYPQFNSVAAYAKGTTPPYYENSFDNSAHVTQSGDVSPNNVIASDASGSGKFLLNRTSASNNSGKFFETVTSPTVITNRNYRLSFKLANENSANLSIIQPSINGVPFTTTSKASGLGSWQQFDYIWNSGTATTAQISLETLRITGSGNNFGFDELELCILPHVDAIDDAPASILNTSGGSTTNVVANDTLSGVANPTIGTSAGDVTLHSTGTAQDGTTALGLNTTPAAGSITMNTDGTITVAPNTTEGVYQYTYEICEVTNPLNCDTATVSVLSTAPEDPGQFDVNGCAFVQNMDGTYPLFNSVPTYFKGTTPPYYENTFINSAHVTQSGDVSSANAITSDASGSGKFLLNRTGASDNSGKFFETVTSPTVITNRNYRLSFKLANESTTNISIIKPSINGVEFSATSAATGTGSWQQFDYIWNSGTATTAQISLETLRVTGSGNDFGFDELELCILPHVDAIDDAPASILNTSGGSTTNVVANDTLSGVANPTIGTSAGDVTLHSTGTAQDGTTALGLNTPPAAGSITMNTDGTITVAPNTTEGVYQYTYEICEVTNPLNCDTATVSVLSTAPEDSGQFDVNGCAFVQNMDGTYPQFNSVAAYAKGTTPPYYENSFDNSAHVTQSGDVSSSSVIASDASGSGKFLFNRTGSGDNSGTVFETVISPTVITNRNYRLSFKLANSDTQNISIIKPSINGVEFSATSTATGTGSWQQFDYIWNSGTATTAQIALLSQRVTFIGNNFGLDEITLCVLPHVDAIDDAPASILNTSGGSTTNVVANDTLSGVANPTIGTSAGDVTLHSTGTAQDGTTALGLNTPPAAGSITMNTDGTITVAPNTTEGVYQYTYEICEVTNPLNCDTATVSVLSTAPEDPGQFDVNGCAFVQNMDGTYPQFNSVAAYAKGTTPPYYENAFINSAHVTQSSDVSSSSVIASDASGSGKFLLNRTGSGDNSGTVFETVTSPTVITNRNYRLSFKLANSDTQNISIIKPSINGVEFSATSAATGTGSWQQFDYIWNSGTATTAQIALLSQRVTSTGNNFGLDEITLCVLPHVDAIDDAPAAINSTTGGSTPNVVANDTLNGVVNPTIGTSAGNVTLQTSGTAEDGTTALGLNTTPASGSITMNADGTITVASNTTAATYQYTYEICEVTNPTNCDTAVATVVVDPAPIDAIDDAPAAINSTTGGSTANVVANDTLNGVANPTIGTSAGNVTLQSSGTAEDGTTALGLDTTPAAGSITMNPDGTITVAPNTTEGVYQYTYEICEVTNPLNCDTATVSVLSTAPEDPGQFDVNGCAFVQNMDGTYPQFNSVAAYAKGTTPPYYENAFINSAHVTQSGDVSLNNVIASDASGSGKFLFNRTGSGDNSGTVFETVTSPTVITNRNYRLSFKLANSDTQNISIIKPSINGVEFSATSAATGTGSWQQFDYIWNSGTATTAQIALLSQRVTSTGNNFGLDEITLCVLPHVDAIDDAPASILNTSGGSTTNVVANDTLSGVANPTIGTSAGDVTLHSTGTAQDGTTALGLNTPPAAGSITMNTDGTITVAPNTTEGVYQYTYEICEVTNPLNCDTATVSVLSTAPEDPGQFDVNGCAFVQNMDGTYPQFNSVAAYAKGTTPPYYENAFINSAHVTQSSDVSSSSVIASDASGSGKFLLNRTGSGDNSGTVFETVTSPTVITNRNYRLSFKLANSDTQNISIIKPSINGVEFSATSAATGTGSWQQFDYIWNSGTATTAQIALLSQRVTSTGNNFGLDEITLCVLPHVDAIDDAPAAINSTTGGSTPNVVANDTLNGVVNPTIGTSAGNVTLQTSGTAEDGTTALGLNTTPASGSITMNADGTITVASNTTAATYQYTYEICEVTNPTNCDTAVATVVVDPAPIDAIDDAPAAINSTTGGSTANVVANDTLNGVANPTIGTSAGNVTLQSSGTAEDGTTALGLDTTPAAGSITMNPDGTITVAPNTTEGVYQYTYEICEVTNPLNCDTATVSVLSTAPEDPGQFDVNGCAFVQNMDGTYPQFNSVAAYAKGTTPPYYENAFINSAHVTQSGDVSLNNVIASDASGSGKFLFNRTGSGDNSGTVFETVTSPTVITNRNYRLSFKLANSDTQNISIIKPSINGVEFSATSAATGTGSWQQFDYIWNSGTATTAQIALLSQRVTSTGNNFGLDEITLCVLPHVDAIDDAPTAINSTTGGSTANVVVNDTLNGVTNPTIGTSAGNVTLQTSGTAEDGTTALGLNTTPASGSITMNADGTITVAPNTTAATYQYVYEICEVTNPTNCDTAVATVVVNSATIDAIDDAPAAINSTTGGSTANVVVNDTLNGVTNPTIGTSAGNVTLQTSGTAEDGTTALGLNTTPASGSITMNADGTITVASNTTAGTYQYTYEICEVTNPTNCDTAVATVVVDPAPIDAIDDAPAAINSTTGDSTANVVANDTLNGVTNPTIGTSAGNVTLQSSGTAEDGTTALGLDTTPAAGSITMNPDGTITVAPNTTEGVYQYTYEICEVTNPLNCDTATVSVLSTAPEDPGQFDVNGCAFVQNMDGTYPQFNSVAAYAKGTTPPYYENAFINSAHVTQSGDVSLNNVIASDASGSGKFLFNRTGSGDNSGTVFETVTSPTVITNRNYRLSFKLANSDTQNISIIKPSINGVEFSATSAATGTGSWQQFDYIWNSGTATTAQIALLSQRVTSTGNNFGLDEITLCVLPHVDAIDDAPTAINSTTGGSTANVVVNDTLNGVTNPTIGTSAGNVTLQTSGTAEDGTTALGLNTTPASGSITMNADGTITVAPNTTAATYQYVYEICEVTNPTNCDTAVATVVVNSATIDAIDDAPAAINSTTGGSTANVVVNDTLNGVTNPTIGTSAGNVTLQTSGTAEDGTTALGLNTTPASGSITMNADGTITVASNTTAATYQYTYEICEVTNPTNCDTAVATVVVDPAPIDAIDDAPAAINSTTGDSTANVVANDTLNGVTNPTIGTSAGNVTLQSSGTAEDGTTALGLNTTPASGSITMNADGTITVAPNTTEGVYQYTYEICEVTNPLNCDTATVSILSTDAPEDPGQFNVNGCAFVQNMDGTYPRFNSVAAYAKGTTPPYYENAFINSAHVTQSSDVVSNNAITSDASGSGKFLLNMTSASNNSGTVFETVISPTVITNRNYRLSFKLANSDTQNISIIKPSINGVEFSATSAATGTGSWQQFDYIWNSGTATTAQIALLSQRVTSTGNNFGLDEITLCVLPHVDAIDDAPAAINSTTGGSTANVVANDTLNGVANPTIGTSAGNVTLQTSGTAEDGTTALGLNTTPASGSITMNADGTITVAPNTTAATYQYVYEICEVTNPTNCDTAVATVVVNSATIDAIDDAPAAINSTTGGSTANVVANDTLNGVANPTIGTSAGNVTLQTSGTAEDGTTALGLNTTPASGSITMNADGTITVASNTTAATYQYTYEICEVTNSTNCDTAVATVVVNSATIDAIDDAPAAINSTTGGSTPNVVANDTLNGVTNPTIGTNPGDVTLQTSGTAEDGTTTLGLDTTPAAGSITMSADGTMTVAANTTAGTYQYAYEICEVTNSTNCDTAVATVVVNSATIDAIDDAPAAINSTTGGSTANVVANDTLNGVANPTIGTSAGNVTLQTSGTAEDGTTALGLDTTPAAGSITMSADGTITVASNTTAGAYQYTYEICEVTNPTNCDTAVATVVVDPAPIDAIDDAPAAINSTTGGSTPNVVANDTLNGVTNPTIGTNPGDVTLQTSGTAEDGTTTLGLDTTPAAGSITMSADGTMTVAANTTAGTYQYAYEICEVTNSTNCDTAVATVVVNSATIDAIDDAPAAINSTTGGSTANVVANDTLNGVANPTIGTSAGDVTLQTSGTAEDGTTTLGLDTTPASGSITMNADGTITVASNTTAATYQYTYEICEVTNSTNCDTAVATVVVNSAIIDAIDDTPAAINSTTGGSTANVVANDTLNGVTNLTIGTNPGDVTIQTSGTAEDGTTTLGLDTTPAAGSITMSADGTMTVAANTTAGTYQYAYEICEVTNSTNCDTAVATVVVNSATIDAIDDTPAAINSTTGGSTPNVVANDTLNGVANPTIGTSAGDVTLQTSGTAEDGTTTLGLDTTPAAGSITMSADGTMTVASNTTAGTYEYTYEICEVTNPTNCDTAVATVVVNSATIDAIDDAPAAINSTTGGSTANVVANDTLNGVANPTIGTSTGNVTLQSSGTAEDGTTALGLNTTPASGSITMNADGTITIAPNTTAGTYQYTYEICEVTNPTNCDTAEVTVPVEVAPIEAVDVSAATPINGVDGGTITENVLTNDTLNGVAVDPSDVTLVPVTDGPLTVNADGSVTVAPNTPAGTYTVTYEICEVLNPSNCDTAEVTVPVLFNLPPVTENDSASDQTLGQAVTINPLANDTDSENNLDPTTVMLKDPAGNPVKTLVVEGEGTWVVDPVTGLVTFTPEAGYVGDPTPVSYTVKDTLGLESTPATITIDYEDPAALIGTVWLDRDKDGVIDPDEDRKVGWTLNIKDSAGNIVATTETDSQGNYSVTGLIPAEYMVEFVNSNGTVIAEQSTGNALINGQTLNLPLPIDPNGIVYNSVSRNPVEGVTLQLLNSQGTPIDAACLGQGQQNQVTGADGFYAFDVLPDAHASCPTSDTYRINVVAAPAGYFTDSEVIPAQLGVFDSDANEANCTVNAIANSNSCEVQAQPDAPQGNQATTYYMDFLLSAGDTDVIFNHLPIDLQLSRQLEPGNVVLRKVVNKKQVSVGDQLYYSITAENTLSRDIIVDVSDDLPTGFKLISTKVKVIRAGADGILGNNDDAVSTENVTGTDPVRFEDITLGAGETIRLGYLVKVGTGATQGNAVNKAQAFKSDDLNNIASNLATASVQVIADSALDQSTLIGKVFHDRDGDGYQDPANVTGVTVKSDYFGWNSLHLGGLNGRVSVLDNPEKHRKIVRMPVSNKNAFKITTQQGTVISVNNAGQVTEQHVGLKAKGLTAQDIRVTTRRIYGMPTQTPVKAKRVPQVQTQVLEITITNHGINEEGIPGVRLATVGGLLIETDGFGRYHIPDVDGGRRSMGKNFILKVDPATLPQGARFTTENPRVLRITGAALNKINFGVKLPVQHTPQRTIQQKAQYETQQRQRTISKQVPVYKTVDVGLGSIFFNKNEHTIRADQRGNMDLLVAKIKRYGKGHIKIDAYTDSRHNAKYNIGLAQRRANTIRQELQRQLGSSLMRHVKVEVDRSGYKEVPHNDKRSIDYQK